MTRKIEYIFPAGDQIDLEHTLAIKMVERAEADPEYANTHPWGEFYVLQGDILHGVQWSYVGEEVYDEDLNVVGIEFPDGVDWEVDCSWHEEENYTGDRVEEAK